MSGVSSTVEQKLDKIIALLEEKKDEKPTKIEEVKQEVIQFMLKNYNITWLDDSVEEDLYEVLFAGLAAIFGKLIP